jgi:hypothetical protein
VRGRLTFGIEVKAARRWKPEFGRALREMHDAGLIARCFGVYGGSERLQDGPVCVLPIKEFMRDLAGGQILS